MAKLKIVSSDFDSTLSDSTHRHGMIDRTKENGPDFWDLYSMQSRHDAKGPAFALAKYLTDMELPWIIVSGRSECARGVSNEWLAENGLRPWHLYLCDERHDYLPHGEWKAMRLLEIQQELGVEISFHIDDIKDVKAESEKVGIQTVLTHDLHSPIQDHLG